MPKKVEDTPREWTPWEKRPERQFLRTLVGAYYDWQRWEISARLRGVQRLTRAEREDLERRVILGEEPDEAPEPRRRAAGKISPVELTPQQLLKMDGLADNADKTLAFYLKEIEATLPLFGDHWAWLKAQVGIGPVMGGFILSQFDPHRARTPSSYWKFAGLHVVPGADGRGHSPHPVKG